MSGLRRRPARTRSILYGIGVAGLAISFGTLPLLLKWKQTENLNSADRALTGSEIMRGVYVNSGSRDIGPDKEWDHKSWTYHGRNLDNFDPTDDDIRKWRAKVEEEQERLRRQ